MKDGACSALKEYVENKRVSLLVSLGKVLNRVALHLSDSTGSNRWQFDSMTEKVTLLSPG